MKKWLTILIIFFFAVAIVLFANNIRKNRNMMVYELSDISYGSSNTNIVHIRENDEWIPYLVVDNYNEKCLVVRKNIIKDMAYNTNSECAAYYPGSEVDAFLNSDYLDCFSDCFIDNIEYSQIEVTSKESLGICGENTELIRRKVFILSYTEAGGEFSSTNLSEGRVIEYFSDKKNRIATDDNNVPSGWWLRTPNTWYTNVVCGINTEGVIGVGGLKGGENGYINGIRPAFFLNAHIKLEKNDGKYYLKENI